MFKLFKGLNSLNEMNVENKIMKCFLFFIPILICSVFYCNAQKSDNPLLVNPYKESEIKMSAEDKTQILKAVLSDFDSINKWMKSKEDNQTIYLSTENIPSKTVSKLHGINFELVNLQEINEKAKTGFTYYAFQEFKVIGSKVYVSFAKVYVDSGYTERNPGSSGSPDTITGIRFEFSKITGKWQGQIINGFQSQS